MVGGGTLHQSQGDRLSCGGSAMVLHRCYLLLNGSGIAEALNGRRCLQVGSLNTPALHPYTFALWRFIR